MPKMSRICFKSPLVEQVLQLGICNSVGKSLKDFNLLDLARHFEGVNRDCVLLVVRQVFLGEDFGFAQLRRRRFFTATSTVLSPSLVPITMTLRLLQSA